MARRLYLDSCRLCRPFDNQAVDRIRLEAEAVLAILRHVNLNEWELVASEALLLEVGAISSDEKKAQVEALVAVQAEFVRITAAEDSRMLHLRSLSFNLMDALHIACAESAGCEMLLTTDDRLRRTARRHASVLRVRVENPLQSLQEQFPDAGDGDDA